MAGRPYYTIHDTAFGALASGKLPSPESDPQGLPSVIGVTNLYFLKVRTHSLQSSRSLVVILHRIRSGPLALAERAVCGPQGAVDVDMGRCRGGGGGVGGPAGHQAALKVGSLSPSSQPSLPFGRCPL